jgi:hypothetical protein
LICSDISDKLSISKITGNAAKNIESKKFKSLEIRNTTITEIGENDFSSILIVDKGVLTISGNKFLTKIHPKALSNVQVKTLELNENALENDAPNQLDIFEVKYLTQKLLLRFKHKDSNMNYEQGFSRGCRCGVAPLKKSQW